MQTNALVHGPAVHTLHLKNGFNFLQTKIKWSRSFETKAVISMHSFLLIIVNYSAYTVVSTGEGMHAFPEH